MTWFRMCIDIFHSSYYYVPYNFYWSTMFSTLLSDVLCVLLKSEIKTINVGEKNGPTYSIILFC